APRVLVRGPGRAGRARIARTRPAPLARPPRSRARQSPRRAGVVPSRPGEGRARPAARRGALAALVAAWLPGRGTGPARGAPGPTGRGRERVGADRDARRARRARLPPGGPCRGGALPAREPDAGPTAGRSRRRRERAADARADGDRPRRLRGRGRPD